MNPQSYFPNYFSIDDIFVTQERVTCHINSNLPKLGFLDSSSETEDLQQGKTVDLPLWYLKELKVNNPYFTIQIPDIYKNVHKAVCEAETTHLELGRFHQHFYEYGRYLTPYDRNHIIGRIVSETCRQRVRHLLDISKNTNDDSKPEHRLENIENQLYDVGIKTNNLFTNWLQLKSRNLAISELVSEHSKKRKRVLLSDDDNSPNPGNSKK